MNDSKDFPLSAAAVLAAVDAMDAANADTVADADADADADPALCDTADAGALLDTALALSFALPCNPLTGRHWTAALINKVVLHNWQTVYVIQNDYALALLQTQLIHQLANEHIEKASKIQEKLEEALDVAETARMIALRYSQRN